MGEGAGPDQAAAERRFRFELAAHPGSPAQARRLARARLTGWSVCEDTCDTAALVISELVTNAIVHTASGTVVCELHDRGDLVRIAVRDEGCAPGEPHPSPQRPDEEHGRGLFLVDALCHAWGAHEQGSGLLVWADLARGGDLRDHGEGWDGLAVPHGDATSPGDALCPSDAGSLEDAGSHGDPSGTYGGLAAPRNDLGWGSRPKRGPADGSGDEDDPGTPAAPGTPADPGQSVDPAHAPGVSTPAGHGEQGRRGVEPRGRLYGPAPRAHRAAPATDAPLPRVAPQRQHRPETGGHPAALTPGPGISAATGSGISPSGISPVWSAGPAFGPDGETPSWRPHRPLHPLHPRSGTGRDLDRDTT